MHTYLQDNESLNDDAIAYADSFLSTRQDDEAYCDEDEKLRLLCEVAETEGVYIRLRGRKVLSNFVMRVVSQTIDSHSVSYDIEIVGQDRGNARQTFTHRELKTLSLFKERLSLTARPFMFMGSQTDLIHVEMLLLQQPYAIKNAVGYGGVHWTEQGPVFLSQACCVTAAGEEHDGLVLNDSVDIKTELLQTNPIEGSELQEILQPIFAYNRLAITATVMGYLGSCFLRPMLRRIGVKHGSLLMIGESGSGKSTTLDALVRPILGYGTPTSAFDMTEASLRFAISSSNAIPFVIEEFKPAKLGTEKLNMVCNTLRNNYDQTATRKYGAAQSIIQRELLAPIILVGESQPSETAIRERCLQVLFAKDALNEQPEYTKAMRHLQRETALLKKMGRSMLGEALSYDLDQLKEDHESMMRLITERRGEWPERVRNSVANAYLGIDLLGRVCDQHGLNLEVLTGLAADELLEALCNAVHDYLLDGSDHNRSVVEDGLTIMLGRMQLEEGVHYKYINRGKELALDLNSTYTAFLDFVRKVQMEKLPLEQFRQQLRASKIYIDDRAVRFKKGASPKRAVILDVAVLRQRIGDALPSRKQIACPAA